MIALGVVIAVALFVVLSIHAAGWVGAHFLIPELILAALWLLGLWLYHRRQLARIHELHNTAIGRWRRLHIGLNWPKACTDCGQVAYDWRGISHHDAAGICAAAIERRHEPEPEPGADRDPNVYTLRTVPPAGRGSGQGAIDTLTDTPELETGEEHDAN